MSSDDRFREMFYEEARELLIGLEEGLMDLERRQTDRAHLDRTFRAAHSLKGAAAMVGLAAIAEFTHGIEAVLERIRSGSLAVDSDIITTLLEARDHLAMMIEAEAMKSPIPASGELSQRLGALLRGPGAAGPGRGRSTGADRAPVAEAPEAKPKRKRAPRKTKKMAAAESAASAESKQSPGADDLTLYQITLVPGPDVLRRGVNPLGVLDELRELGETTIATDPNLVPPLEQLDPERCYLTWTIEVKTAATPERLSEAFLFFSEDSALSISRRTSDGKLVPVPLSPPPVEELTSTPPIGFEKPAKRPAAAAPVHAPAPEVSPPAPGAALARSCEGGGDAYGLGPRASAARGTLAFLAKAPCEDPGRRRPARRPGRSGRRAGGSDRQPAGFTRDSRCRALDACARGTRAGEPGGQGHHA